MGERCLCTYGVTDLAKKNWKYITPEEADVLMTLDVPVWYRSREGRGYPWLRRSKYSQVTFASISENLRIELERGGGLYYNNKRQRVPRELKIRVEVE